MEPGLSPSAPWLDLDLHGLYWDAVVEAERQCAGRGMEQVGVMTGAFPFISLFMELLFGMPAGQVASPRRVNERCVEAVQRHYGLEPYDAYS
eukprot:1568254-Rhodomonas_salina.1